MFKIRDLYTDVEARSIAYLVLDYLGHSKRDLLLKGDDELDIRSVRELENIAYQLSLGKPVQYILGYADFFGLKFRVDQHVMIPRSETEELVDLIIKENTMDNPRIIDVGTGSGCIAVCLGKFIEGSEIYATDISEKALQIARFNAEINGVIIHFYKDDIFRTKLDHGNLFDILASNPPYVTESEKKYMHPNILDYEPKHALFVPDDDPLKYYNKIAEVGISVLKKGSRLYVEINERYGDNVTEIFNKQGFDHIEIIKDINNKDRIVKAIKPIN